MITFNYEANFKLENEKSLENWIGRVIEQHGCEVGEVNYIFCDDVYLHKLNIEFNAFEVYIDNLSKLIPRINRWGNIDNMTQFQLDCEACSNNIKFKTQISIMDFNPPKLERN